MNFAFSEEQEFLRETARRFLEDKCPSEKTRALMATGEGFDAAMWSEMAGLGWQSMAIPEEYGGAGFGFLETSVLLEEMGRVLLPAPFISTVILGANLVLAAGSEPQKQSVLPAVAEGTMRLALASTEPSGRWDEMGITMEAQADGAGYRLSGTKSFVLDGHTADLLIVAARTEQGVTLFLVPAGSAGIERRVLESMDQTRKLAEVTFTNVSVPVDAVLGPVGGGWPVLESGYRIAAVALAVEAVGGAQKVMEMAVEYAKARIQFGRPIGSFQAIKHKCADMLVGVESAKSAAYYAAWAVSEGNDEVPVVAPLAKSYCTEQFFSAAAENIQIHGGIGFTWEHDAHLYFKRAKSSEILFGDPAFHRSLLADQIGV